MSKKKRLAVIGLNQGWKFVTCLMEESDALGAEIAAVCDSVIAHNMPPNSPDVPVFDNYEAMLEEMRGQIDGVICALPNHLHLHVTQLASEMGLAVLMEKPIAGTLEDAKQMIQLVNASKIPFMVGHHRRFSAGINRIKEMIDNNMLGRIIAVNLIWTLRKPDNYFDQKWRITPGAGGPLLINVIHEIDTMLYLVGEIDMIHSFTSNLNRGFPVEDAGVVNIKFKNSAILSYVFADGIPSKYAYELTAHEDGWFHPMDGDVYYFFGDEGQVSFPSLKLTRYTEECCGNNWLYPLYEETFPVPRYNPLRGELELIVNMINGTGTSKCTAEDATETLRCVEAIRESAATGKIICMDDF